MPEKAQTFMVNIAIIEGRHYIWPNMNSTVTIKIENQKKSTSVKFNSDCPFYNEYFVFEFLTTLEKIIDMSVTITVIKPGSIIRKRKILGCTTFDVGTVWYQDDHQVYHKWAILSAPSKDFITGTRGYLKLDVSVLSKGELPKIPAVINTDDIETNLFLPSGAATERQRIEFVFDIYRGVELVKKNPIQENIKKHENPASVHLEISFSGSKIRSGIRKNVANPVWNERLVLPELFPPLCQRFKIELYHDGNKRATRYLNLRTLSSDKEEGFLPTFGPDFIHFYSPNNLEGYLGKVLIGLDTVLLGDLAEYESNAYTSTQQIPPLREDFLLNFETVIVYATIFEASSISRKFSDKPISFRLSCGPLQVEESGDKTVTSTTTPIKPKIINKNYCFLPIEEVKPCMHVTVTLPDIRKRMYNHNLLAHISAQLKSRLDKIEEIFHDKDYKIASEETETLLLETLDFISSAAGKYIDIASNYNFSQDEYLDLERLKISLKEMDDIMVLAKEIPANLSKKKIFQKIEKFYSRIEAVIDIIEDWPQIYLWMIYGSKRVAYQIIQPRNVIHSPIDEEKGVDCGALRSIYLKTEHHDAFPDFISSVGKVDIMVWMGLPRHLNDFLPTGFNFSSEPIPRSLISDQIHLFQARAHIFQGRFTPGSDRSGLCDPFIDVLIGSEVRQTQVLRKILTPIWDQTLIFQKIILYGDIGFILANPPTIIVDVYDKDECCKFEAVGKCITRPVVKPVDEPYVPPKFPPRLAWHKVYNKFDVSAEILAIVELLELSEAPREPQIDKTIVRIPPDIKPNLVNHKVEVVFWGVRNLKKVNLAQISRPKITLECGNSTLSSETLANAKKSSNFTNCIKVFEANFPEQEEYAQPLCLKMFDCRSFGITVFAGTYVAPIRSYMQKPMTAEERERRIMEVRQKSDEFTPSLESVLKQLEESESGTKLEKAESQTSHKWKKMLQKVTLKRDEPVFDEIDEDDRDFDWWTKFYASLEETPDFGPVPLSHKYKLKVYPSELENQPEFADFHDTLVPFPMYKGKRTGDESVDEENTTGIFKGALRIYRWPPENPDLVTSHGLPLQNGYFQDFPSNNPLRYVLRVYCVRGINLQPKDLNGKSDPYLHLALNQQIINDKENRMMGQINPVFGRCFEFTGVFPQDNTLVISVMDWDRTTADDLIGLTKIDVENRFYTKHRAGCGLAQDYLTTGYCTWRDQQKPTVILESLCKKFNISDLEYGSNSVVIAGRTFCPFGDGDYDHQILALEALKHWSEIPVVGCHLVPEHVETRSLFNPNKPGIEQGKIQLWIDVLPTIDLPTPKQINITPRQPVDYELRVIVWNAENITLEDTSFFSKGKKSDVFIKGWVSGPEQTQYTDVHYSSDSGEANFNWRFVFPLSYLVSENRLVLKKKSTFGSDVEEKLPCNLTLQAWDNDTFSLDEFLGVLTLEISRLPKGASDAKTCTLDITKPHNPRINLFKVRRTKGWWPLKTFDPKKEEDLFAGALELEFELLTKPEAEKCPAGLGRSDPQGLAKPNRPESSFSWFKNPLKAFKFGAKFMRKGLIRILIIVIIVAICASVVLGIMKYGFKKLIGKVTGG